MPEEIKTGIDYQEKYKQLGDEEIREILLKRKSYQAEAARAAIQEAISRGILKSEQDLFSEEYNIPENWTGIFFPFLPKPEQRKKTLAALHRIYFVLGLIPVALAWMKYSGANLLQSFLFIVVGLVWMFLNFRLSKTKSIRVLHLMLAGIILASGYALYSVLVMKAPEMMDFAVVVIAFGVSFYCLLFVRSILKSEN